MKGIKYIETLKLAFKKTTVDAYENEPKMIFKTAYFNSKAKIIINENEINESIQTSNQEILNGIAVSLSEGSGWTVESIDEHHINIVNYKPLDHHISNYHQNLGTLINRHNNDNECFRWCHI